MRNAFAATMLELANRDERVVLLSGDIGNRLFDKFKAAHPTRFYNCGVAEANMMSMAAGMAMTGLRPVVYTITPFITTRCLEQIKVDVCYHAQPVTIVGVGAGLGYAQLGVTHHSCEDIAQLRTLPGMTVVCPADPVETKLALAGALEHDGPVYLRIGKKGEPTIHAGEPSFALGRGIVMREGSNVCLLSTGTITPVALEAADVLHASGITTQVVSLHTIKPMDETMLTDVFKRCDVVATIEEHSVLGGLGGAVAEWRCAQHYSDRSLATLVTFGTPDQYPHTTMDQDEARAYCGLTAMNVAARLRAVFGEQEKIKTHANPSRDSGADRPALRAG